MMYVKVLMWLLGITGAALLVYELVQLARSISIRILESRVKRHLPLKLGFFAYTEQGDLIMEVLLKITKLGVQAFPLHRDAAMELLAHHHWKDGIARSRYGEKLDCVIVSDLRAWNPVRGGKRRYIFRVRPYNKKGFELEMGHGSNEVPLGRKASQDLVRLGHKRVLQALLALQGNNDTDPKWGYDTSQWPYSNEGEADAYGFAS